MDRYRHGRVFFAGDAAHQVSPFGARGANGGMQDIDNLGWKLAAVINDGADDALLNSYHEERKYGAMENIKNSSRTADFLTPRNSAHRLFRDAVLDLVEHHDFARPLVNSGRLSVPCTYDGSTLNGEDALPNGPARNRPGSACSDAPWATDHILGQLGNRFTLLAIDTELPKDFTLPHGQMDVVNVSTKDDATGALQDRYLGANTSAIYLIRPDQHVASRWAKFDAEAIATSIYRALGGCEA